MSRPNKYIRCKDKMGSFAGNGTFMSVNIYPTEDIKYVWSFANLLLFHDINK